MTILSGLKKAARTVTGRPSPMLLTVKKAWRLTPNMIRIVLTGPELAHFPEGREGGNCKILLPDDSESREHFARRLVDGPAPVRRTYTVRHFESASLELSIDFVAHGASGPASRWASRAKAGDYLGFIGASAPKVAHFEADWYIIAADLSAIPVAAATLEAMPRDAKGVAIFEVTSPDDQQAIDAPAGVEMHWLVHPDPLMASDAQENFIRTLEWPNQRIQTCIAGESGVIRSLKAFIRAEKKVARNDAYLSGYWKIGLVEDEHQKLKRAEND